MVDAVEVGGIGRQKRMTAPVHFKGVKSAQGAKRPEGQMSVWTMDENQEGARRWTATRCWCLVLGRRLLGDRVRMRRCGDWLGSNLTAVSAYVDFSLGPDGKGGLGGYSKVVYCQAREMLVYLMKDCGLFV